VEIGITTAQYCGNGWDAYNYRPHAGLYTDVG